MMNCRLLALTETRSTLPPPSPPPSLLFLPRLSLPAHPSTLLSESILPYSPSFSSVSVSIFMRLPPSHFPFSVFVSPFSFFSSCSLFLSLYFPHNFHSLSLSLSSPFLDHSPLYHSFIHPSLFSSSPSLSLSTLIAMVEREEGRSPFNSDPVQLPVFDTCQIIWNVRIHTDSSEAIYPVPPPPPPPRLLHTYTAPLTVTY